MNVLFEGETINERLISVEASIFLKKKESLYRPGESTYMEERADEPETPDYLSS